MRTILIFSLLLGLAGGLPVAWGQTGEARITGTVTDSNGAVIPGARLTVKNQKTGVSRDAAASDQGRYIITNLPPSQYSVTAGFDGLGPSEYRDIALTAGQERTLDIVLQPAALQQEVTVSGGELVVIDTSSARVGANINQREVATLPLNGRQLSQLYLAAPGALTAGGGSYDNIRFSGRANQQNAIRFDGIEASSIVDSSPGNLNGETSTGFRLQSSLENVQEFRVESSNYPAEFGTGSAGQISVVTKSGANEFHGSLFEYVRNDKMDARNFFDGATKSPLRLNQFGASLGGPIRKDRLFFFASYEGLRQRASQNIVEAVPSPAAKARAVPSIRPLLDAYPAGVATSNPDLDVARLTAGAPIDENYGSVRLDYRINDRYSIVARYFRDQGELILPLNVTGNYARTTAVPQNGMVALQQILSSTVINETKVGFNGSKTRFNGVAPGVNGIDLSAVSVDFTGTAVISGVGGQGASAGAARIGGLVRSSSAQNGRAVPYTNYTVTLSDQLSWVKGSHTIKFGGEVRPIRMYTDRLGGATYTFSNIESLLANRPSSVQVIGDVSAPNPLHGGATGNRFLKQTYYIGYAQDEWKIRPNLTMNYGLRYE
ncbi:MAG: TonB-dependent receptor, partial [Bryobacterales bacterium]|nr:TonB-dependent receptor [Bryobacterales bacterium]